MKPKVFLLADDGYPGYATTIVVHGQTTVEEPRRRWRPSSRPRPRAGRATSARPGAGQRADQEGQPQDDRRPARPRRAQAEGATASSTAATRPTLGIGVMTDARWTKTATTSWSSAELLDPTKVDYTRPTRPQFVKDAEDHALTAPRVPVEPTPNPHDARCRRGAAPSRARRGRSRREKTYPNGTHALAAATLSIAAASSSRCSALRAAARARC